MTDNGQFFQFWNYKILVLVGQKCRGNQTWGLVNLDPFHMHVVFEKKIRNKSDSSGECIA